MCHQEIDERRAYQTAGTSDEQGLAFKQFDNSFHI